MYLKKQGGKVKRAIKTNKQGIKKVIKKDPEDTFNSAQDLLGTAAATYLVYSMFGPLIAGAMLGQEMGKKVISQRVRKKSRHE
jgi:hypothetical protein